ncbi:hypothetical protein OK016_18615 [Vibrio chagasii]|nr:hypothetical protein [Vibrio chagasii]
MEDSNFSVRYPETLNRTLFGGP